MTGIPCKYLVKEFLGLNGATKVQQRDRSVVQCVGLKFSGFRKLASVVVTGEHAVNALQAVFHYAKALRPSIRRRDKALVQQPH
jgi:hypothetical protein